MSSVTIVQVPVKMGSNKMLISLAKNNTITCRQFIELVLEKCKMDKSLCRTYAIFESNNGIEKKLHSNQSLLETYDIKTSELVIRRYFKTEKKVVQSQKLNDEQRQKMIKKCYQKLNQGIQTQSAQPHLATIEQEYLKEIIQNDYVLKRQNKQLSKVEQSINDHVNKVSEKVQIVNQEAKITNNINVLQFLYCKLKKNSSKNMKSYKRLADNDSCGNSSDEESSSNGSQRSTSSLHALESLV